jgi:hypothetical protein
MLQTRTVLSPVLESKPFVPLPVTILLPSTDIATDDTGPSCPPNTTTCNKADHQSGELTAAGILFPLRSPKPNILPTKIFICVQWPMVIIGVIAFLHESKISHPTGGRSDFKSQWLCAFF